VLAEEGEEKSGVAFLDNIRQVINKRVDEEYNRIHQNVAKS